MARFSLYVLASGFLLFTDACARVIEPWVGVGILHFLGCVGGMLLLGPACRAFKGERRALTRFYACFFAALTGAFIYASSQAPVSRAARAVRVGMTTAIAEARIRDVFGGQYELREMTTPVRGYPINYEGTVFYHAPSDENGVLVDYGNGYVRSVREYWD